MQNFKQHFKRLNSKNQLISDSTANSIEIIATDEKEQTINQKNVFICYLFVCWNSLGNEESIMQPLS